MRRREGGLVEAAGVLAGENQGDDLAGAVARADAASCRRVRSNSAMARQWGARWGWRRIRRRASASPAARAAEVAELNTTGRMHADAADHVGAARHQAAVTAQRLAEARRPYRRANPRRDGLDQAHVGGPAGGGQEHAVGLQRIAQQFHEAVVFPRRAPNTEDEKDSIRLRLLASWARTPPDGSPPDNRFDDRKERA